MGTTANTNKGPVGAKWQSFDSSVDFVQLLTAGGNIVGWIDGSGIPQGFLASGPGPVNVVFAGDSITNGSTSGSLPMSTPVSAYSSLIFGTNKGIVGDTCSNMIIEAPTVIDPQLILGAVNILHVWCGTNDFAVTGATVATTYANLQTYCNARRAKGWKVIVGTMLSRTGNNAVGGETLDSDAVAYNALIRANYTTFADGLSDFGANLSIGPSGNSTNLTWFVDGVHPTAASVNQFVAPIAYNAIQNLIPITRPIGLSVGHISSGGGLNLTTAPAGRMAVNTGNLIVCHLRYPTGLSVSSLTDTAGNTFTLLPSSNASGVVSQWAYAKNCIANAANVVTLTLSGNASAVDIFVWEVVGADRINPFDVQAYATGSGFTGTTPSFSTTVPNEIVLVAMDSAAINNTFSAGGNFTLDSSGFPVGAGNLFAGATHSILTAQQNLTASITQSQNAGWFIHAVGFRGANLH